MERTRKRDKPTVWELSKLKSNNNNFNKYSISSTRRGRLTRQSTNGHSHSTSSSLLSATRNKKNIQLSTYIIPLLVATIGVSLFIVAVLVFAQTDSSSSSSSSSSASYQPLDGEQTYAPPLNDIFTTEAVTILPPPHMRPNVRVNLRDWTRKVSDDIKTISNRTSCLHNIERFYEQKGEFQSLDLAKLRDQIISQINILLAQHRDAVTAIVSEAERLAVAHNFVKNLRFNYTDVHRLRNELDPNNTIPLDSTLGLSLSAQISIEQAYGPNQGGGSLGQFGGSSQVPQFTSINGGTPVPGPAEWQTPIKSIVMHVNKNFGDIPVNTSMSAIHLPLPIYAGLPDIMNGIAWTERLDYVFKRNLATYAHVHHQYYGDHLGFMRTFPAHKWRIARTEPDLFDARTRPWYVAGASSPKDVIILIDASGSMTGLRREIAKGVVFEILDTLTNNDYFAVMRFSETLTPIGLPKCNLKTPKLAPVLEEQCRQPPASEQKLLECQRYRWQLEQRAQYLRDHPNLASQNNPSSGSEDALNINGSYLSDEAYKKSIYNVTQDIQDAYLLPATSRNVRYLKSNFSMPTAGIANFTHALMGAFELLAAYNRTGDQSSQCNQAIMLITDGAIKSHEEIFNRYNYPNAPVRVFTYMIGREVGDITHTKAMACNNRGYYTHVINLGEVREQVQKYLPVMSRPLILSKHHPTIWTGGYGDETHQVLTDWVLEAKRRERARIMLNEEREKIIEANSSEVINIEFTGISEYDESPLVGEELKNRIICEDNYDDDEESAVNQSLEEELDPLGYNELGCHWSSRRADLLTSVVKPVYDTRNTTLLFERILHKNIWTEKETHVRNAQLLGVAAVDLRIGDIMRSAPSHLFGPNGYAILMDQSGFIMHHPDLRALLEDPFDKHSKILKPHFNAVDLSHVELVNHKNESDPVRKRDDDLKLNKFREAIVRRQTGFATLTVKRAVDCRRRPHIRQQLYYYGPIKDTPFSFIIAVPQNYGLNRMEAKLELNQQSTSYFKPSTHDLWTVHPEYKYCNGPSFAHNTSLSIIMEVMRSIERGDGSRIDFADAGSLYDLVHPQLSAAQDAHQQQRPKHHQQQQQHSVSNKITCDKDLFRSLLFDAAATYEKPDSICGASSNFGANCDQRTSSPFASFYSSRMAPDELCAHSTEEMRSKLANIYGLEMSFLATRSGLTRVRVFDLGPRIKKLADLFIKRHNKAVDEAWYSRTVDWNLRFNEDATIITVPYNAYVRLLAKLRQRITQRHPAANDTRANCDPIYTSGGGDSGDLGSGEPANGDGAGTGTESPQPPPGAELNPAPSSAAADTPPSPQLAALVMDPSEQPIIESSTLIDQANGQTSDPTESSTQTPQIDYNQYSSFDFLDMLTNSSVHVSATQAAIANKNSKQRTPVAVSGLLYDYATFARRFLNATSLDIKIMPEVIDETNQQQQPPAFKVDICPNGECPVRCGLRNDTIDCLLVDNNGFIVVGEELAHIGRSLLDYDSKLMQSLVERKIFHQINMVDYQAICTRNNEMPVEFAQSKFASTASAASTPTSLSQISSSALGSGGLTRPIDFSLTLTRSLLTNLAASLTYFWTSIYSLIIYHSAWSDFSGELGEVSKGFLGEEMQWQRSAVFQLADAQSAMANQSLLALLPNKTYLRPCEKTISLYETRPTQATIEAAAKNSEEPEYFVTECGCSGWYVYEWVPKTNLMMLIVNTTSACRRNCESAAPAASATANVISISAFDVAAATAAAANGPNGNGGPLSAAAAIFWLAANKTAEEQVCTMLERDSQLYTRRQTADTCYSHHPEESHIHICGAASSLGPSLLANLLITLSTLTIYILQPIASKRLRFC